MANSKANIYPIQLQGAELNLNKYDAEIKQYSGFNKNNSPFVGGCLANVFTKDEHLDAETESMYIDTNGDVYTVDENALYCNGVTLFKFNRDTYTQCNFWQNEKLEVSDDVVFIYSDKIMLKSDGFNFTINGATVWNNYEKIDNINDILTTRCTGVFLEENLFVFAGFYKVNNAWTLQVTFFNQDGTFLKRLISTITLYGSVNAYGNIAILKLTSNNFLVSFFGGMWCRFSFNENYDITLESSRNQSIDLLNYSNSSHLATSSLSKCICINYPVNKIYVFAQDAYTPSSYVTTDMGFVYEIKGFSDNKIIVNPLYAKVFYSLDSENQVIDWRELRNEKCLTPYCCSYESYLFGKTSTPNYGNTQTSHPYHVTSGLDDFVNCVGFHYSNENVLNRYIPDYVAGSTVYLNKQETTGNNHKLGLLLNNHQLSGIAGDFCLLTDWNTVNINTVYINANICYYKQSGYWYKLSPSAPKVRRIANQLVVNVDYYNSWDLKKKKKLLFAPNFNFSLTGKIGNAVSYTDPSQDTFKIVGIAVNEYSLENNPSLLLNPITIPSFNYSTDVYNYKYKVDCYVNYNYKTLQSTDSAIYAATYYYQGANQKVTFEKDLYQLPFPIQTDGNVQYSPCLFSKIESQFGNQVFINSGNTSYPLAMGNNNEPIMAYFLASGVENLDKGFIIQGQFYGLLNNGIYSLQFSNGVVTDIQFIVDIANMQYVGNTPYMAIFFSKTNRCLYAFTGANVLNKLQFVDKISEIKEYGYNPTTQTNILITDIGVIMLSSFGTFLLEYTDIVGFYLQDEGICLYNDSGDYHFIKYYKTENDGYTKQNIRLETCFYGMNNQTVTINDCLYVRLFSEEHESGDVEMTASTLSNFGRKTEKTTFKIKSSDWDKMTHSIYLRYQPKEQRGLGVSFSINSPFKIAALSVGSQPDAILIDKVSKTAINAPQRTTNNSEW